MATPKMTLNNLVDSLGRPLPQKIRDELREAIVRVIAHPDADVSAILRRAQVIGRRAIDGEIESVLHYATKVLHKVSRKKRWQLLRKEDCMTNESPDAMIDLAGASVEGSPAAMEARVLLAEVLGVLSDKEREVFVRYTSGWGHKQISKELGISVAMSSYYLQSARDHLRQARMQRTAAGLKES